jgi:hypothetical protein
VTEQPGDAPGRIPPWWTDPTKNVESLVEAAMARQDDLREMESAHVRELMELRAGYDEKLRRAETERIDAIRAVDVGAVNRAAEVQDTRASALAAQVATTADAFRASLAAALAPIQGSIEDLRRAQYETQGQKQQVVETRGDARLNLGAVVGVAGILIALISLYLYATRK